MVFRYILSRCGRLKNNKRIARRGNFLKTRSVLQETHDEPLEDKVCRASEEGRAMGAGVYASKNDSYLLDPDGVGSVKDDLFDYCALWNQRAARSASKEMDVLYFLGSNSVGSYGNFQPNVSQLEKKCAILTRTNGDNGQSAWKVLAVLAAEKGGANPTLFIYDNKRLFADPKMLYSIGERYSAEPAHSGAAR